MTQKNTLLVVGLITLFTASVNAAEELPTYQATLDGDVNTLGRLTEIHTKKLTELTRRHQINAEAVANANEKNVSPTKAQIQALEKSKQALLDLAKKVEALKGKAVEIKSHIANS